MNKYLNNSKKTVRENLIVRYFPFVILAATEQVHTSINNQSTCGADKVANGKREKAVISAV